MNLLEFAALVTVGFVACAEFGSYAFVHPVIRRLPASHHIRVEQGLLRTFGRFMPVGMTAAPVLALTYALAELGPGMAWRWAAVVALVLGLICTILVNVKINVNTGRWDPDNPPADWQETRGRWELFQGVRSWLLLIGFVLLCAGVATG